MKSEKVYKKVKNGKTYLSQVQNGGTVYIEVDESDLEMSMLIEDSLLNNDLSKVLQHRREMKKA